MEGAGRPAGVVTTVAVVGAGVAGLAAGRVLVANDARVTWIDTDRSAATRAASRVGGTTADAGALIEADVALLATPAPHAPSAAELVTNGTSVVSLSDDPDDVADLLSLDAAAAASGTALVVGASLAPGLTGLLVRHLVDLVSTVDEIHIAMHGTGGPACARQHHRALGSRSLAWHDHVWIERPGGSGRELSWFPDPIGAVDCYRAALADPLLLHEVFPDVQRISARVSATRRDRLTARLPMLTPPRRHGDVGGIRVEVRGADASGSRVTHVAGASGRAGDIAGIVAGACARAVGEDRVGDGVVLLGADPELARWLLPVVVAAGVTLQEFTGVARSTAW